ncbi:MAG TPA: sugar phosphate nucleotidyltransferase [Kiritimatiellia bacterium]|nr:sugar phosphate nucleotidyltransferase [Kiritimatiellia bacterium]
MPSVEQAILLCGGLGTRLRALYSDRPKALVPVHGKPFIEYVIDGLIRQNVKHIHIAAGYRADQIKAWAEKQTHQNVHVTVSIEPASLGTAGGLKFTETFIDTGKPILVMNGDSLLMNTSFDEMIARLQNHPEWVAVLAAVEMTERGQFGTVEIDEQMNVTAFREKAERSGGWVNGGIYLMRREIFSMIPGDRSVSIETEIFPQLAGARRLGALKTQGPLLDMGTPEGLERTENFLAGKPIA